MPRSHCVRIGLVLLLLVALPSEVDAQKHRGWNVSATATHVQTLKQDGRVLRPGINVGLEEHSGNDIRRIGIGFVPASDHTPRLAHLHTGVGAYRTRGIVTAGARLGAGVLHTNADAMTETWAACAQTTCLLQEPAYRTGWALLLGAAAEMRFAIAQRLALVGTVETQSLLLGRNRGESFWVFAGGVAYRF